MTLFCAKMGSIALRAVPAVCVFGCVAILTYMTFNQMLYSLVILTL